MVGPAALEQRIALGLRSLPITEEQWERDHDPIVAENLPRLVEMVRASQHLPSGPMLDIGFGYGYSASALRSVDAGRPLVALEHPSRELTRRAVWSTLLRSVDAVGVGADALALPFRDRSFAVVAACEILEHLSPPDGPRLVSEAARVLRPGGVLVLTTPNLVSLSNRLVIASGRSPLSMPTERIGCVFGHLREYTTEEVQGLLAWAGLEGIGTTTVPRPVRAGAWRVRAVRSVESLLWRVGTRRVGGFIVAWARKP
jgi:SAM-dependent methyltransferase